jgi:hypothetical protein
MPRLLASLLIVAVLGLLAVPAVARSDEAEKARRDSPRSGMNESLRRVEKETGGTVLSAERQQRGGRDVYRVKVLDAQGRVRVVQDDPAHAPRRAPPAREASRRNEAYRRSLGDE